MALERADALRDRVVAEERETALKVPSPLRPHITVYTIYSILCICLILCFHILLCILYTIYYVYVLSISRRRGRLYINITLCTIYMWKQEASRTIYYIYMDYYIRHNSRGLKTYYYGALRPTRYERSARKR